MNRAPTRATTPPAAAEAERAARLRGIGLIIASTLCFTLTDTIGKHLIRDYHVVQVTWARFAFHFLLMAPLLFVPGIGRRLWHTRRPLLHIVRASVLVVTSTVFFVALIYLPLADAYSISFVSPLFVILLAIPILGETAAPRHWLAVGAGLIGALVIIRPGMGVASWASALPLLTASLWALFQVMTRLLGRSETALTLLFHGALVGTAVTSLAVPFFWRTPDTLGAALMAVTGVLGLIGQLLVIRAYRQAAAAAIAPFVYTQLIWATTAGYFIFGDLPDGFTIAGATIIVASGLYLYRHERRAA